MKKTFCALLTLVSLSAFAQSLDHSISRKIDRLSSASTNGDIARLSRAEKDNLNNLMDRALQVIRANDYRPGPGIPGPGIPGHPHGTVIVAILEHKLAVIRGASPGDMLVQCNQVVGRGTYGQVDDIVMTVNGGRFIQLRNHQTYWTTTQDICQALLEQPSYAYERAYPISVIGTIEDAPIQLNGTRDELLQDCASTILRLRVNRVDDMRLSINNGPLQSARNSSSYWESPAQICGQIASMVDAEVY